MTTRCTDDLHEHTLIDGVFVCRDCGGLPEQPPVMEDDMATTTPTPGPEHPGDDRAEGEA